MAATAFKTKINKQLSPSKNTPALRAIGLATRGNRDGLSCLVGIVLFVATLNNKSLGLIKILTTDH